MENAAVQTFRILLFGPAAACLGREFVDVTVDRVDPVTIDELFVAVAAAYPPLSPFLAAGRLAVNHNFADVNEAVSPADEIALIAMVSGG